METTSTTTEASVADAPIRTKRALELGRAPFTATEDGAFLVLEMPKRPRCSYMAAATPRRCARRLHFHPGAGDNEEKKRAAVDDEAEFGVRADGAYHIKAMLKKFKSDYMAKAHRALCPILNAVDAQHARMVSLILRRKANEEGSD